MIIEHFVAAILVCALQNDKCVMYQDKKGPVDTRVECQVNMDALWQRIILNDTVIENVGTFSANQADHRGFCFNSTDDNRQRQIERMYDL